MSNTYTQIHYKQHRVDCPADFPAGRASHTTVRTGRVYSGSLRCGAIDTKSLFRFFALSRLLQAIPLSRIPCHFWNILSFSPSLVCISSLIGFYILPVGSFLQLLWLLLTSPRTTRVRGDLPR